MMYLAIFGYQNIQGMLYLSQDVFRNFPKMHFFNVGGVQQPLKLSEQKQNVLCRSAECSSKNEPLGNYLYKSFKQQKQFFKVGKKKEKKIVLNGIINRQIKLVRV